MEACRDCTYRMPNTPEMVDIEAIDVAPTCLAFYPAPIPDEILDGTITHDIPMPTQQNTYVFRALSQAV